MARKREIKRNASPGQSAGKSKAKRSISWYPFSPWHNSNSVLRMAYRKRCVLLFTLQQDSSSERLQLVVKVVLVVFPIRQSVLKRHKLPYRSTVRTPLTKDRASMRFLPESCTSRSSSWRSVALT